MELDLAFWRELSDPSRRDELTARFGMSTDQVREFVGLVETADPARLIAFIEGLPDGEDEPRPHYWQDVKP